MIKNLLLLAITIILCCTSFGQTETNPSKKKLKNRLDSYLIECDNNGLSASILVAQDGEILFNDGLGLRNKKAHLPVTTSTILTTGSLSKQFTATAILKLQEHNRLSVNDSISKFLKNVPIDKQGISIHQLLTHTSGIINNLGYGVDFEPISKDEFLDQVYNSTLEFEPGKEYRYSNVGYSVLAIIIEEITEVDYDSYLKKNLFDKAGMTDTGYLLPDWNTDQIANGYKCGEDWGTHLKKWKEDANLISWHLKGNGGILSNPSDLYKWYKALQDNKIISKESLEQLTTPHVKENESGDSHYGYGWVIFNSERDTRIIAHNGSNGVFYADFLQLPEENTVIIYMTNELRYDTQIVAWEIEKLLFNNDYKPVVPKMKSIKYSPEDISNEQLQIIHQFVDLILNDGKVEEFEQKYISDKETFKRFEIWFEDMKREFSGYRLKHILEYGDMSYDIILKSPKGETVDLTPCFDLQFNEKNQINAFGW